MTSATTRRGAILVAAALLAATATAGCSGSKETLPAVQRLDLTPPAPSLPRGAALQLRATAVWNTGAPQDVGPTAAWTSSNPGVAAVAGGLVTGLEPGSTTITVTWSGQSAAVAVTVTPAALVAIAVDPPVAALPVGTHRGFTATGTYSDGTTRDLTGSAAWSSSDPAVVALPVGEVRAVSDGAATVTASHDGRQASAAVTVTAPVLVELRVAPWEARVPAGLTTAFTATGVYSDGSTADLTPEVLWAAEGDLAFFPGGAPAGTARGLTVGGPGLVRALLPGSAVAGQASLTVTDAVPLSIDVTPGAATLAAGLTRAFLASAVFSDGHHADVTSQATWTSSSPLVAAVSTAPATAGQVSALAAGGPVTITAALAGTGARGSATLTVADAAVASIDVAPAVATVAAGRTQAFTAEAVLTDGRRLPATDDATWSSSDPGLAPVSNAAGGRGTATGLRAGGPVTISARLPGVAPGGAAALTVAPAALTGLLVEPASLSLAAGTGGRLLATGLFSDGSRADLTGAVTWTSATPAGVAVGTGLTGAGVVSALVPGGPVTVTAALPGGGPTASAEVTVTPAVLARLELSPAGAAVALGRSAAFHATGVFSDGARQDLTAQVSWLSSDVAVATVSNALASAGVAQSRGEGTAQLTAWFPGTAISAAASFTVTPPELIALAVSPASATVPAGRSQQFSAAGSYSDGVVRDVTAAATWRSGSPAVAALTATAGLFRGAAPGGPATITAALDGLEASAALTVGPAVLESIAVSPAARALHFGETVDLTADGTYSDATHQDLTGQAAWSAAPGGVVQLAPAGGAERARAVGLGSATVSARVGAVAGTAQLAVEPVFPTSLAVLPATLRLLPDGQARLRALGTFPGGAVLDVTDLATWSSSDAAVAAPEAAPGAIRGVTPGTATVTATFGASGAAAVTVTEQPFTPALDTLLIGGAEAPLAVGGLAQLTATGLFDDGHQEDLTGQVAWTSSDPQVVAVDAAGLASALAPGAVTVTATDAASGRSGAAILLVRPDAPVVGLVVRLPPRVVAGQPVRAVAIGQLEGGGEIDLTEAVQWLALAGAEPVGGSVFALREPLGRVAAAWEALLVVGEAEVVPLSAASSYRILPGDAVLRAIGPFQGDPRQAAPAVFAAVLGFDDAWPRQVVAGQCTNDPEFLQCAFAWMEGTLGEGCQLPCAGGNGVAVCVPVEPTTRTIECTAGGLTATASVTVQAGPVPAALAGLLVRPAGWAQQLNGLPVFQGQEIGLPFGAPLLPLLHPGDALGLEAVALRSDGTFGATGAAWSSTDPRVAGLAGPGQVLAHAPGATVVQAAAGAFTASQDLEVLPSAGRSPVMVQGPAELLAGAEPAQYTAVLGGNAPRDVTASVVWRSSDPAVARPLPGSPGLLEPVAPGLTTLTATTRDGQVGRLDVAVVGVEGLELYPTRPRVGMGEQLFGWALARYTDGTRRDVSVEAAWRVADPQLLFDEGTGIFTGNFPGTSTITADWGGFSATVPVEVTGNPTVFALDSLVVMAVPAIPVGGTGRAQVWAFSAAGDPLPAPDGSTFATADPAVAAPDGADPALLRGLSAGTTTLTVTDPTGQVSGSGPVTVYQLASLAFSPAGFSLAVGEAASFQLSGVDTDGRRRPLGDVPVTSSDPAVALASPGSVQALAEGAATLTATLGGVTATADVAVGPAAPLAVRILPEAPFLELGARFQLRVQVDLTDGTTLDATPQASLLSLDPAIAAFPAGQPHGTIEALALGEAVVRATVTAAGRSASAVTVVGVVPPVGRLELLASPDVIAVGETATILAGAILPALGPVDLSSTSAFASSAPDVAAAAGPAANVFLGKAPGVTTVTVTTAGGATAAIDLVVTEARPLWLTIDPALQQGTVDLEVAFTATARYSDGTDRDVTGLVDWFVDGPVELVGPGRFIPRAGGTFLVGAAMLAGGDGLGAEAILEVPHVYRSLEVVPQWWPRAQGDVGVFAAIGVRDDGVAEDLTLQVTWSVDRADALLGPDPGVVRFDGHGHYVVTAALAGGPTADLPLDVAPVAVSLTLSPSAAVVGVGAAFQFTATGLLTDGATADLTGDPNMRWSVVDGAVAEPWGVGGVFLGRTVGITEVVGILTVGDHQLEARATLQVVPVPVAPPRVEPFIQSVSVGGAVAFALVVDMSDGSVWDRTAEATWEVDLGNLAARSEGGGVFTGLLEGSTGVWATLPDQPQQFPGILHVLP